MNQVLLAGAVAVLAGLLALGVAVWLWWSSASQIARRWQDRGDDPSAPMDREQVNADAGRLSQVYGAIVSADSRGVSAHAVQGMDETAEKMAEAVRVKAWGEFEAAPPAPRRGTLPAPAWLSEAPAREGREGAEAVQE